MACSEKQAFFHRASGSTEKDSDAGGLLLYVHDTAAAELAVTSWYNRDKKDADKSMNERTCQDAGWEESMLNL